MVPTRNGCAVALLTWAALGACASNGGVPAADAPAAVAPAAVAPGESAFKDVLARGAAMEKEGRTQEAADLYCNSMNAAPGDRAKAQLHVRLAHLMLRKGDLPNAVEQAAWAERLAPGWDDAANLHKKLRAKWESGETAQAVPAKKEKRREKADAAAAEKRAKKHAELSLSGPDRAAKLEAHAQELIAQAQKLHAKAAELEAQAAKLRAEASGK